MGRSGKRESARQLPEPRCVYPDEELLARQAHPRFTTLLPEAEFSADVLGRAMRLARDELPFGFVPAPFTRTETAYGSFDLRDGIEPAVIGGVLYDRDGTVGSLARLIDHEAVLPFGNIVWARIARLAGDGSLVGGCNRFLRSRAT